MTSPNPNITCSKIDLDQIGNAYGKILFEIAVMAQMPLPEFKREIDRLVDECRLFFTSADTNPDHVHSAMQLTKLGMVEECNRLLSLMPADQPEHLQ